MIRQPEALLDEHGFVGCQCHFGVARLDELSLALRDPFEHFQLNGGDQGDRSLRSAEIPRRGAFRRLPSPPPAPAGALGMNVEADPIKAR